MSSGSRSAIRRDSAELVARPPPEGDFAYICTVHPFVTDFESTHEATADAALEWLIVQASLLGAWGQLRTHLERHGRDLQGIVAADPPRPHSLEWLESVEALLARSEPAANDELELALRARLRALVAAALSASMS